MGSLKYVGIMCKELSTPTHIYIIRGQWVYTTLDFLIVQSTEWQSLKYSDWIYSVTLIFDKHLGSSVTDLSVKFQSDRLIEIPISWLRNCEMPHCFDSWQISFWFRCVVKDFEQRPSIQDLQNHPFIKQVPADPTLVRQVGKTVPILGISTIKSLI